MIDNLSSCSPLLDGNYHIWEAFLDNIWQVRVSSFKLSMNFLFNLVKESWVAHDFPHDLKSYVMSLYKINDRVKLWHQNALYVVLDLITKDWDLLILLKVLEMILLWKSFYDLRKAAKDFEVRVNNCVCAISQIYHWGF